MLSGATTPVDADVDVPPLDPPVVGAAPPLSDELSDSASGGSSGPHPTAPSDQTTLKNRRTRGSVVPPHIGSAQYPMFSCPGGAVPSS